MNPIITKEPFTNEDAIKHLTNIKEYFVNRLHQLEGENVVKIELLSHKLSQVIEYLNQRK